MFLPEGFDRIQRRKKISTIFTFAAWTLAINVVLLPSFLSASNKVITPFQKAQEEVLGISENNIEGVEVYSGEHISFGTEVSETERANIIKEFSGEIKTSDYRAIILKAYIETFRCGGSGEIPPLANYTDELVAEADSAGLNWRITTAIAGVETWFGCAGKADYYHNAWGYGGGPSTRIIFPSWEDGIQKYSSALAEGYGTNIDKRLYEIASYYVYGKAGTHDSWADGVTKYLKGIEQMEQELNRQNEN